MSAERLLPCPFCGGRAEAEREGTSRASCKVACTMCGCRLESGEIGHGSDWNSRARPTPEALRAWADWFDEPENVVPAGVNVIGNYPSPASLLRRIADALEAADG